MKRNRIGILAAAGFLAVFSSVQAYAMEAPGDGEENWYYSQKDHHWYYYDEDQSFHTGWLKFQNEWYWFDEQGWMEDNGFVSVDGIPYYFFINGHMAWNQYVGIKYYDGNGQNDEAHDVRVIGKRMPTLEERDLFSDDLYEIPRSWIAQFVKDGWQLMFYTDKSYFAAPNTNLGIYYVYHSVDTHYKKVKFTDVDSVQQAFGEYIGYASGCYKEGNAQMQVLWEEQQTLEGILDLPSYYADDAQFYFGKVFAAYLDPVLKKDMMRLSPKVCEVMEDLLHLKDDVATRIRLKEKAKAEQERERELAKRRAEAEGFGPGVKRQEEHETEKYESESQESESQEPESQEPESQESENREPRTGRIRT